MYLGHHHTPEYQPLYGAPHTMAPSPETMHAANAFGRMAISQDHALEKLAANVRAATTTSASDRAKQIFVQAWQVLFPLLFFLSLSFLFLSLIRSTPTG